MYTGHLQFKSTKTIDINPPVVTCMSGLDRSMVNSAVSVSMTLTSRRMVENSAGLAVSETGRVCLV